MPTALPQHCPKRGTRDRRAEQRERDQARGSAAERGYLSVRWRATRAAVLAEEPLCRICQADGRITAATEVDHIVPRRAGGGEERGNLQPLCKPCHSAKTVREDGGLGRGRARGQG